MEEYEIINSHFAMKGLIYINLDNIEHICDKLHKNIEELDKINNLIKVKEFREESHKKCNKILI